MDLLLGLAWNTSCSEASFSIVATKLLSEGHVFILSFPHRKQQNLSAFGFLAGPIVMVVSSR